MLGPVSASLTLVVGSEEYLVDRAVTAAVAVGRARGAERRIVEGSADTAARDLAEALSPTLFDDAAVIVVRDADALDDEARRVLEEAATAPPPGITLVVVHPGGNRGRGVLTAMRAVVTATGGEEVSCAPLRKGSDTLAFLTEEVRRHRRAASADALRALYDAIGHDLGRLAAAVSQLCADVESDPLGVDDVRRYFAGVADVAGFTVSDDVWDQRGDQALRDLRWMLAGGGAAGSLPAVTSALAGGLRAVARVQGMGPGASPADVARDVGLPPWKVRLVRGQARRWRPERLAAATVRLSGLDLAVKGGEGSGTALEPVQKHLALERFVVEVAGAGEE